MEEPAPLEWTLDDTGVYRAFDDYAIYVISRDESGRYAVGFFPAPGPECNWGEPCYSLEAAKASAELCAADVMMWVRNGYRR